MVVFSEERVGKFGDRVRIGACTDHGVPNIVEGGVITAGGGVSGEFLTSNYGASVPTEPMVVSLAHPSTGCAPSDVANTDGGDEQAASTPLQGIVKGSAVLVDRGTCSFQEKVAAVQASGGAAVIIANNVDASAGSKVPLLSQPLGRWDKTTDERPVIFSAMVTSKVGSALRTAALEAEISGGVPLNVAFAPTELLWQDWE